MNHKLTPTIGMEIHVELATKSKMFCGCPADHFATIPNTQTCPVCLGLPGALPVPNKQAVDWTIMIGLALNCRINLESKFDRKHYFYPDLPKGYQISQYDEPLCEGGYFDTSFGRVGITRVHLEEDTGKLQHTTLDGKKVSLVDFNRGGVPLVEIVTEPDITSSAQAKEYAKKLATIIRSLEVSSADMEKGSMRLEANISLGLDLGYKVEVKNINSFRFLEKAIDYELKRQRVLLEKGETPAQETRGFSEAKHATFPQRSKEEAQDYRYFPEPDIPSMKFTQKEIDAIKSKLPRLPVEIQAEWQDKYGLHPKQSAILIKDKFLQQYCLELFAAAVKAKLEPAKLANLIINKKVNPHQTSPAQLIKDFQSSQTSQVSDTNQLSLWINQVIKDNPKVVADYQGGKDNALQFLMGQVMHLSKGQASPPDVIKLLQSQLS